MPDYNNVPPGSGPPGHGDANEPRRPAAPPPVDPHLAAPGGPHDATAHPLDWTPPRGPQGRAPTGPSRSYPYAAPAATDSQPGRRIIEPARPTPTPPEAASLPTPRRPQAPEPGFDPRPAVPLMGSWEALAGSGQPPGGGAGSTPVFDAPAEPPAEKTRRKLPLIPISIGAAVVLIAGVVAYQVFGVNRTNDPGIRVTVPSATAAGARIAHPGDLVRQYFSALQAGDVTKAQSFGPVGQGSRVTLKEQVVRQSLQRLPLTDVSVTDVTDTSTEVPVTYKLGGEAVSTTVQVRKQDDGGFLLQQSTVTVPITARRTAKIPLLVNGEELEANSMEVFPGSYVMTTGLPFVQYDGADLQVSTLDARPEVSLLTPALTKQGRDAVLEVGKKSLSDCLTKQSLTPSGCPFAAYISDPIVPGSIKWYLENDPWTGANPRLSSQREVAEVLIDLRLAITLTFTNNKALTRSPLSPNSVALRVDVSRPTVEALEATWER